jgi:membrane protein implicated in regulation of membrane protease activity
MRVAEHTRSVEAAQERLRRVRTEAAKALGEAAVAPSGDDLLVAPAAPPPVRLLLVALAAAAALALAVLVGPLTAAGFFAVTAVAALLVGESRAKRAARLRREIEAEIDGILGRLETYVTAQAARAREEAGTLDRAKLQHSIREGTLLARLAPVPVRCPACGLLRPGAEFARKKGCPRCRSDDALVRPAAAAAGLGAQALAEYALWAREAKALAKAIENAHGVAELARRAEREVKAGRAAARA